MWLSHPSDGVINFTGPKISEERLAEMWAVAKELEDLGWTVTPSIYENENLKGGEK